MIAYPQTKTLEDILKSKKYKIPLYQRPYSWIDQVSELWSDINNNTPPYFLGILMLKPLNNDSKSYEVVDGQQRLCTLMLLLRAAVEVIKDDEPTDAADFQRDYINQRRAGTKEKVLTLEMNRRDKPKFESIMLGTYISNKRYSSWKNMENAYNFFISKFEEMKSKEGTRGITNFILNKVLELHFLDVHVDEDNDIYLFFETLNDRGMDLSIADLVKNRVCAMAQKENLDIDETARKIDEISDMIGTGKMKGFLLHYCWSRGDEDAPTPQKKLMDWYGKVIDNEKGAFITQLETAAIHYAEFINPSSVKDTKMKEVLIYLNTLGATRCYPLLLQGVISLSIKEFVKLCKAIEILTFRHSTVAKKDAKNLENVYYS